MPTHFRWVWYLVGLAGMALMVLGIIAIIGSAIDTGILIPLVVVVAIVIGYALVRFSRSLDAALAAAPSRRTEKAAPASPEPAVETPTDSPEGSDGDEGPPAPPRPAKPAANPGRTSRR